MAAKRFSRDAVLKGSFDKYAVSEKRKRGTAEVDAAFLAEIERWRDMLARNIALRNPELTNRQPAIALGLAMAAGAVLAKRLGNRRRRVAAT